MATHEEQVVADPVQLAQGDVHSTQAVPWRNVTLGQADRHWLL